MGDDDKKEDMGTKLSAPADFDGPMSNRGCTDSKYVLKMMSLVKTHSLQPYQTYEVEGKYLKPLVFMSCTI